MSVTALVADLQDAIPDAIISTRYDADVTWVDVTTPTFSVLVNFSPRSSKFVIAAYGSESDDSYSFVDFPSADDYKDRKGIAAEVKRLFTQAEQDKLLVIALVNLRPVFLPRLVSFDTLVRATPFGNLEKFEWAVVFRNDADGNSGTLSRGGSLRLSGGAYTEIVVTSIGHRKL